MVSKFCARRPRAVPPLILVALFGTASLAPALAQTPTESPTPTPTFTVTATITVTETRTNRQRVVVSTQDGVYTAASLAPEL